MFKLTAINQQTELQRVATDPNSIMARPRIVKYLQDQEVVYNPAGLNA